MTVTGVDVGVCVRPGVVDGIEVGEDTGGSFVVIIAGIVVLTGEVGFVVVAGEIVFDVQLKIAVKIKKDRTIMVKALPNIILFSFIQIVYYPLGVELKVSCR